MRGILVASGQWLVVSEDTSDLRAPRPSPLAPRHSSLATHHSPLATRSGISLIEVLASIGILTVGLWGVVMLLPLGKLAMMQTERSDRTGACGRAALREVEARRMLDATSWYGNPGNSIAFVIDPLYYSVSPPVNPTANPRTGTPAAPYFGGVNAASGLPAVPRITFADLIPLTTDSALNLQRKQALAEKIFVWQDELLFDLPKDRKPPPVPAGDRPLPVTDAAGVQQHNANFTWFLTVSPKSGGAYNVSVVVCQGRKFTQTGALPDGEESIGPPAFPFTTFPVISLSGPIGYGGLSIQIAGKKWPTQTSLKSHDWILLYSARSSNAVIGWAAWYRVVSAGFDGTNTSITLVGPDWYGGDGNSDWYQDGGTGDVRDPIFAVFVDGVTGVYTTTMQLDDDLIWSR